jgi:hypothetical protein
MRALWVGTLGAALLACADAPEPGLPGVRVLAPPGTEVRVVAVERMTTFIEAKVRRAREQVERTEGARASLKWELERLRIESAQADQVRRELAARLRLPGPGDRSSTRTELTFAVQRARELGEATKAAQHALDVSRREASRLDSTAYLLDGLPAPDVSGRVEARGTLELELSPGRYAVVASQEDRLWLAWVVVQQGEQASLKFDTQRTGAAWSLTARSEPLP